MILSAGPVVDHAPSGCVSFAGIAKGLETAALAGADRSVLTGTNAGLVATATTTAAAFTPPDDVISCPVGNTAVGECLALAAAARADWLVFPRAISRAGSGTWDGSRFIHDHGTGREQDQSTQRDSRNTQEV